MKKTKTEKTEKCYLKVFCALSSCAKRAIFGVDFLFLDKPQCPGGGGGGIQYKSDKDAHHLALGFRLQILVSLRVFGMERHYICPFR